jgi:hypothetical protein
VLRIRVRDAVYWETADSLVARVVDFARGLLDEQPGDLGTRGRLEG